MSQDDDETTPDDEAVFTAADLEIEARQWRAWQRDRTARLEQYTAAVNVLFTAVAPRDEESYLKSSELPDPVRRSAERTIMAILDDMRRIAVAAKVNPQD